MSIFKIDRDLQIRPFARDLMNVSSLAFDKEGYLYASSRSEGTVYRISPEGAITTFAEGMGIATGLAFDNRRKLVSSATGQGRSSRSARPRRFSSLRCWNPR